MEDYRIKVDELISQVENGKEKYYKNALFNKCVNHLANGVPAIKLIADLCNINEEQHNEFAKYVETYPLPIAPIDLNLRFKG